MPDDILAAPAPASQAVTLMYHLPERAGVIFIVGMTPRHLHTCVALYLHHDPRYSACTPPVGKRQLDSGVSERNRSQAEVCASSCSVSSKTAASFHL